MTVSLANEFHLQNAGEGSSSYGGTAMSAYGAVGATLSQSTAAYVNPTPSRVGRCTAKSDTCKAFAVKGSDPALCYGHGRAGDK